MKFEIRYPTGAPHEVTLQGTVAVLGRDPSCDLVLNDPKCSRRHAVIEAGPQGMAIRDTGSANGIVVNGEKVERSGLAAGDEVRLGEVVLKVLPEEVPGTVVMGPDEMEDFAASTPTPSMPPKRMAVPPAPAVPVPPRPAPPAQASQQPRPAAPTPPPPPAPKPPAPAAPKPPAAAPPPAPAPKPAPMPPAPPPRQAAPEARLGAAARPHARTAGPIARPLGVTTLAVLWMLGVPVYLLWAIGGAFSLGLSTWGGLLSLAFGLLFTALSGVMAFGLWSGAGWARILQLVLAGLGILTCAFAPVSIVILAYMLRSDTAVHFSGRAGFEQLSPQEAEAAGRDSAGLLFTLAILAALFVSAIFASIAGYFVPQYVTVPSFLKPTAAAGEKAAIARLRTLALKEEAFRAGTCDGFADLEGLLNPSSVIPNYPPSGPTFLPRDFAKPEQAGYRFEMKVEDPISPGEGCPSRSFRSYEYSAKPLLGDGRFFVVGPDAVVRAASGRPATPGDAPLE